MDEDSRSYETKLEILSALDELSKTRPFSKLGVVDVAKKAGISRSAFYYHFSDRNDAVQWLSRQAFANGIDRIGRSLSWYEGHYATTCLLLRFKSLIIAAAQDVGYSSAQMFYMRHRCGNLSETLAMKGVELTSQLSFQIESLAAAEQHMTSAYIRGDLGDMPPQEFCRLIEQIVPAELREAIGA